MMNTRLHETRFEYSARYFTLGEPQDAHELLYVLHGHGQLAAYFIRKFEPILRPGRLIIAPEGLNRYYLSGFTGRVGATWMTREDRRRDIENYQQFLNQVHQEILSVTRPGRVQILGFSQGAATAARWVSHTDIKCDHLILWAGIFPPDLEMKTAPEKLQGIQVTTVYGTGDEYVSPDRKKEHRDIMNKLNVESELHTFEGGHDIDPDMLRLLF